MELFNTTKSLLENLSDISSIFIAFVALIGLYQLVLMKRSTIISSKRDAAKLAFETSNIYDTVFVENIKRIRKVYKDIGVKNFDGKVKTFSIEEYHEYNASWREVFEKNKDKFEEEFREITDKLEAYSVPIIKRISDEDLAFSLDSQVFLQLSKLCFPYYINEIEEDKTKIIYCYIKELSKLWCQKSDNLILSNEKRQIDNQLKKTKKPKDIKPFGA